MIIGKVTGSVVSTRKNDNLIGNKFMIVAVKPVGLSISPYSLKTGIEEIYLQTASGCRVTSHNGIQFLL